MRKTNLLVQIVLSFCVAMQPLFAVANSPKIVISNQDEQAKKELALKQRIEKALEAIRQIEALCTPKIAKLNQQLFDAIEANNTKEAARLIRAGAQVNAHAQENSFTPLMKAIEQGNKEIVNLLLENGADANAEIPIGIASEQTSFTTPLLIAIEKSNLVFCKLLIMWGAHVSIEHLEKAYDKQEIFSFLVRYYNITSFKQKLAIIGIILAFSAAVFGIIFGIEAAYYAIKHKINSHKINPTGQERESAYMPDLEQEARNRAARQQRAQAEQARRERAERQQREQRQQQRPQSINHYQILGVAQNASEAEIRRAYRQLALQFHPDRAAANNITSEEAHRRMQQLNEANEILSNPEARHEYDQNR